MKMKMRLYLSVVIALLAVSAGWVAGCGSNSGPTAPTLASAPRMTGLTIKGATTLTQPGQSSQLSAEAKFSDGSVMDVTSTANWSSSDSRVATISLHGLLTAMSYGKATINVFSTGGSSANASAAVTVLPDGTIILSGRITEAGDVPLAAARVEIIGGPMSGRAAVTDQSGRYALIGVKGVVQMRVTKDGYLTATPNLSEGTENLNVELAPIVPYAAVGGVYRLRFTAADSCHLPDDAAGRTYTATIDEAGSRLTVMLSDAQFGTYFGRTWNNFTGHVYGNAVSFTLNGGYDAIYNGGVAEKLTDTRYLMLAGTADGTVTGSTMSAAFAGAVSVITSPNNFWLPTATCSASDHHLIFTRTTATISRKRF
jgi:hypothetical protein